jgi:hypothetical protein
MSACDFALGDFEGESFELYCTRMLTARREHKCCECSGVIPRGVQYENVVGKWDGEFSRYKTCLLCVEIRDKFGSSGSTFTTLWEEVVDGLFPMMNFGCMDGLSTEARNVLIQRWQTWKGLLRTA